MIAQKKIILVALALMLATLACVINVGGPAYPTPAIPISTEAVGSLDQAIQTAVAAGAVSGEVTLVITETQLTSYLALKLQQQSSPFITNPQVYLREGQIRIYGTATQGNFQVTVNFILTAGVDEQGQLTIVLTSADFGPLPVPNGMKEAVTAIIEEAYTGSLGPLATGFRLESITVADGAMVIVGRIK
ncbi:MAG: hypothetical protein QMD04_00915 [Anaerolineales bacterium]|nr:hypothetical protein [Anaerolineales bacterium]